jgi:hypothetical protein
LNLFHTYSIFLYHMIHFYQYNRTGAICQEINNFSIEKKTGEKE